MSYEKYKEFMQKIADVNYSIAVLNWDEEVNMPTMGIHFRSQQTARLAGIAHEMSISDELGKLLNNLSTKKSLSEKEKRNIRESLKNYNIRKKYTTDFVVTLSKTISESYQAWDKARKENNFKIFQPYLEKIIELKHQECEFLGYTKHPYDALLDQFEPDLKTSDVEIVFEDVKKNLGPLLKKIAVHPQNDSTFLYKHYNKQKQWDFSLELLKQMHYNLEAGRQDISSHPFTTNFSSQDVRITTRVSENDIREIIWSCIHEAGHALYEQGLHPDDYGLPTGEAISLGIHESQSRFWENNVGRSLPYWKANFKRLQELFPDNLKEVNVEEFYKAINLVEPSLIRTSADELSYHFHVLIRFEIEKNLIGGSIQVKDLPDIWNQKYKDYLDVAVPSDAQGVLQDIHWAHGAFGYFPTYSLGSFYAAQFYAKASEEIYNLEKHIENGNLKILLDWLRTNIHQHGKFYSAEELCMKVTGEKLNFVHFMKYAKKKFAGIYNFDEVLV